MTVTEERPRLTEFNDAPVSDASWAVLQAVAEWLVADPSDEGCRGARDFLEQSITGGIVPGDEAEVVKEAAGLICRLRAESRSMSALDLRREELLREAGESRSIVRLACNALSGALADCLGKKVGNGTATRKERLGYWQFHEGTRPKQSGTGV